MKSAKLKYIWIALALFWRLQLPVFAQERNIQIQIISIDSMEVQLDSLHSRRSGLMSQVEELVNQISQYRAKGNLNAGDHRQLQNYLQQSQSLESKIKGAEDKIDRLLLERNEAIQSLILTLQQRIELLIQKSAAGTETEKEDFLTQIQDLLKQKKEWEKRVISLDKVASATISVDAFPEDSPDDLRLKGDLLLDKEENIQQTITKVEDRISSAREEFQVRQKMQDLSREMDLFNENEELLGRTAETDAFNNNFGNPVEPIIILNPEEPFATEFNSMDNDWGENLLSKKGIRTLTELSEWIDQLKAYRNRLNIQADSLHNKAQWFYEQAEKQRD